MASNTNRTTSGTGSDLGRTDSDSDIRHADQHGSPNRDPITGTPGAHPVGAGIGAAGGAAAGAAVGAIGGPVGIVAGGIIGGLLGGLGGKGVAEMVDPTEEHNHWRNEYKNRDYVKQGADYDTTYAPAYQYGWESYGKYNAGGASAGTGAAGGALTDTSTTGALSSGTGTAGSARAFDDVESDLRSQWNTHRSDNDLAWDDARPAVRDAWERTHTRRGSSGLGGSSSYNR